MYLTRKPFKWFQFYLAKVQVNEIMSSNKEVNYIFIFYEGFSNRLIQIYKDAEEKETAIRKLYKLKQTLSVMVYITEF